MLPSTPAQADVNDFVINEFSADYNLSNYDKQGKLTVVEEITVNFSDNNHGIIRAIPAEYRGKDVKLSVQSVQRDGSDESYTTYKENDNLVIKIGSADKTITGQHTYRISYSASNVISMYDGHDEFYWDINGDQWAQATEKVDVKISLGEGLKSDGQLACFAGGYGTSVQNCEIGEVDGQLASSATTELGPNQTLTIVAGFNKGYFAEPTFAEKLRDILPSLLANN